MLPHIPQGVTSQKDPGLFGKRLKGPSVVFLRKDTSLAMDAHHRLLAREEGRSGPSPCPAGLHLPPPAVRQGFVVLPRQKTTDRPYVLNKYVPYLLKPCIR
jgi:hypothetical protein